MAEIDTSIVKAEWADKLEATIDSIPKKFGTLGRYAAMTQDSEIFKLLARATMYGDFLGKGILYDHQVKANKKTPQQALRHASEAFVNYNLLPSRERQFLESKPRDQLAKSSELNRKQQPTRRISASCFWAGQSKGECATEIGKYMPRSWCLSIRHTRMHQFGPEFLDATFRDGLM